MNICVYGASSRTLHQSYIDDGYNLGKTLAQRGHSLVFGGGANGLMGAAARGVKDAGGYVIGVSPTFFNVDGILFDRCDELIYTDTMRERKQKMEDLSDAFIMTPGSIGTFEEFFEILTLKQLGRHKKPIAVLNTNGYFNPLYDMLRHATDEKFMSERSLALFAMFTDADELLSHLENYESEAVNVKF